MQAREQASYMARLNIGRGANVDRAGALFSWLLSLGGSRDACSAEAAPTADAGAWWPPVTCGPI